MNTWYLLSSLRENLEYNQDDHEWIGNSFIQETSHVSSNATKNPDIENKKAAQIRKFREEELHMQDEEELFQHVQRCKEYRLYSSVQDWLELCEKDRLRSYLDKIDQGNEHPLWPRTINEVKTRGNAIGSKKSRTMSSTIDSLHPDAIYEKINSENPKVCKLEALDERSETQFLEELYYLLRCGQLAQAYQICIPRGQYLRAAYLLGPQRANRTFKLDPANTGRIKWHNLSCDIIKKLNDLNNDNQATTVSKYEATIMAIMVCDLPTVIDSPLLKKQDENSNGSRIRFEDMCWIYFKAKTDMFFENIAYIHRLTRKEISSLYPELKLKVRDKKRKKRQSIPKLKQKYLFID